MNYYTYAYLREDRTPYYIGKGKGRRIYSNTGRPCKKPKDKLRIIFLKQNLTEAEAFRHEIYMIAVFGRKDLGTGILRNKTNGGEGCSGLIHSPEYRERMSVVHNGENNPMYGRTGENCPMYSKIGERNHFYGKTHSPETKEKMSKAKKGENSVNYGKSFSPETKAKLSAAKKGENNPNYGKMWITDEITNLMISKNDIIPEGFKKGIRRSQKLMNYF